jgi:hypothetical protein
VELGRADGGGLREDVFHFNVKSGDPANSGVRTEQIASPKFSAVFGPWGGTEFYANAGLGFHSNDGRSATLTRDPGTGEAVDPSTPLVRARGAEIGVRTVKIPHVQTTLAVWGLGLESELIFAGDSGTTEASRPSRRLGFEWATYASPRRWLSLDADVAVSHAKFMDADSVGNQIPGSAESVVSLGASVNEAKRAFGSVRLRYFGPRPLIEDNSVRSNGTSLVNGQGSRSTASMTFTRTRRFHARRAWPCESASSGLAVLESSPDESKPPSGGPLTR